MAGAFVRWDQMADRLGQMFEGSKKHADKEVAQRGEMLPVVEYTDGSHAIGWPRIPTALLMPDEAAREQYGHIPDAVAGAFGATAPVGSIPYGAFGANAMRRAAPLPKIDSLGYYSGAYEAARRIPQGKGTVEQMMAMLKKEGAKDAEIEATGLRKYLAGKPSVTREELEKYLEQNRVQLKEAEYSRPSSFDNEVQKRLANWREEQMAQGRFQPLRSSRDADFYESKAMGQAVEWLEKNGVPIDRQMLEVDPIGAFKAANVKVNGGTVGVWSDHNGNFYVVEHPDGRALTLADYDSYPSEAANRAEAIADLEHEAQRNVRDNLLINERDVEREFRAMSLERDPTKWSAYSLDPNNPTYRETVLHLPEDAQNRAALEAMNGQPLTDENLQRAAALAPFRSGHFPEPNIIGHMMTSQTMYKGRPVYTIDQIQSDWGQKLRDGGVRDEAKIAGLARDLEAARASRDALFEQINPFVSTHEAVNHRHTDDGVRLASALAYIMERPKNHWEKFEGAEKFFANDVRAQAADFKEKLNAARRTFDLKQAELATAEATTPGHPLVNTTDQWVDTTLRRALRQAAEQKADYMAIPSGDTVLGYNPGDTHGMREFYGAADSEGIVPKNLRKLLTKIDRNAPPPQYVDKLDSPSGATGLGSGFSLFPLSDEVRNAVLSNGQPLFARAPIPTGAFAPTTQNEEPY